MQVFTGSFYVNPYPIRLVIEFFLLADPNLFCIPCSSPNNNILVLQVGAADTPERFEFIPVTLYIS